MAIDGLLQFNIRVDSSAAWRYWWSRCHSSIVVMHFILIFQLLVLLVVANGMPVIIKKLLGDFLNYPLDFGMALSDKQPLFGSSKTVRGVILSVIATTMVAAAIGFQF